MHVTADYPDALVSAKTPAIQSLVELIDDRFDNEVISLNRQTPGLQQFLSALCGQSGVIATLQQENRLTSLAYRAPPLGIFHKLHLTRLADGLLSQITRRGKPDLIIGHKLTVEGIVVARLAGLLGIPYGITIQGNTDTRILAARPDLRHVFAKIFRQAAVVFALAPWAHRAVVQRLGQADVPVHYLPCPIASDRVISPCSSGDALLSAFHLRNFKLKNLAGMLHAFDKTRPKHPEARLRIIGGGSDGDWQEVRKLVAGRPGVELVGAIHNTEMPLQMNSGQGFVMPSLRESFGMVFIEALFSGLPILYPRDRAIDGYLDGKAFALRVDPHDPDEIAEAMSRLIIDEQIMKQSLAEWQMSHEIKSFRRDAISELQYSAITRALAPPR